MPEMMYRGDHPIRGKSVSIAHDQTCSLHEREAESSLALQCLRDAVHASPLPQKAIRGARSEAQFSKLLNGRQAFPVAALDSLPDDVCDDFLIRYATARRLVCRRPTEAEDTELQQQMLDHTARRIADLMLVRLEQLLDTKKKDAT